MYIPQQDMDAVMEEDRPNIEYIRILGERDPTLDVHINCVAEVLRAQSMFTMQCSVSAAIIRPLARPF